ncbi:MAG: M48 family metallopeptidase [Cyanobacteria bacterium J06642_9]
MSKFSSKLFTRLHRRWLYGLMALVMSFGIGIATPRPSQAITIWDVIFGGVQILQATQITNMSDEQEVELGRQIDAQLKQQGLQVFSEDAAVDNYLDGIGQRLAATSDRPNLPFTVQVVRDDAVNAFATAGGFVYIQTGLMETASNEAELAGVLAHEIGHITGKHGLNQMKDQAITSGIMTAAGVRQDQLVNIGVQLAYSLPRSRDDENDADRRGFFNMGRAGYDQRGIRDFMQKLDQGGSPPEFISTHPNPGNRVGNLNGLLNNDATPSATDGMDNSAYRTRVNNLI